MVAIAELAASEPCSASQTLLTLSAEHALRSLLPSNAVFLAERLCAQHPCEASWTLLARAHLAAGSHARAARAVANVAHAQNASPEVRYLYAALLFEAPSETAVAEAEAMLRGKKPLASSNYAPGQDSTNDVPGGAAGLYLLGLICQRTARRDEAKQHFRKALSLNPTLWVAAEALASMGVVSSSSALLGTHTDDEVIAMLGSQPQFNQASSLLPEGGSHGSSYLQQQPNNPHQDLFSAQSPQAKAFLTSTSAVHTPVPADSLPPAPPCTPAQPPSRRLRARFTTPSPSANTTPAVPGAPGKRHADVRRAARLLSPDNRDASAVSRILGVAGTPQQTPQQSRKHQQPPQLQSQIQRHPQQQLHSVAPHVGISTLRRKQDITTGQTSQERNDAVERENGSKREGGDNAMDVIRLFVQVAGALGQYKCAAAIRYAMQLPLCHRENSMTHAFVGRAHLELGDYNAAEDAFRMAIKLEPGRVNGVVEYLSTVLWHLKKETDLADLAVHSFNMDRHASATWCAIGNCYSSQRDPDAALRFFKRATRVDPFNAYAHTLAGHEFVIKEDFDTALASYRQALQIDERHYNALYGIGQVLQKQEKYVLAERHYRAALRAHPRNSNLHYHLGVALAASANAGAQNSAADSTRLQANAALAPALKELELAAMLDPRNPVPKFERSKVLVQMHRLADARAQLEGLRDALPREAAVYHELGKVCKRMGDTKAALRYFNNALEIDPKDQGRRYKKAIDTLYAPTEAEE